jgi:hypothetical protein
MFAVQLPSLAQPTHSTFEDINTILQNSCRNAVSTISSISGGDAGNVIGARIGSGNAAVNSNPNANLDTPEPLKAFLSTARWQHLGFRDTLS